MKVLIFKGFKGEKGKYDTGTCKILPLGYVAVELEILVARLVAFVAPVLERAPILVEEEMTRLGLHKRQDLKAHC